LDAIGAHRGWFQKAKDTHFPEITLSRGILRSAENAPTAGGDEFHAHS
jgi:hypothetical protein